MASEIELEISPGTDVGDFLVRVLRSASGGEPHVEVHLDIDRLLAGRDALENEVLLSTVAARRITPTATEPLLKVGQRLFDTLFQGSINSVYRASMMVAQQRGERLRIVLRLNAPGLAALPWEAMWDSELQAFTCIREPLVRHVPAPYTMDALDVVAPLRILGMTASPRGLQELDIESEQEHLSRALAGPVTEGLIELQWLEQATWERVHDELLSGVWHVLHFIGHGDYDVATEQGVIAFVGADGRKDLVDAERLAALLGEAEPTPRLVVLNSCSSGEAGTRDLFSGTAAALVRSGISAVAAMQFTVTDQAALRFARGFYTSLAHGRDIAGAMRSGRVEILGTPGSLEWVTPVLYLRGDNVRLFAITRGSEATLRPPTPHPMPRTQREPVAAESPSSSAGPAQLHAMYLAARAEQRAKHYERAVALFDELLTLDSKYRDAQAWRTQAVQSLEIEEAYEQAESAAHAGTWFTAAQLFSQIADRDSSFRDAAERARACSIQQEVEELREELAYHSEAGNWQAVIEVGHQLEAKEPEARDLSGKIAYAKDMRTALGQLARILRSYERLRADNEWLHVNGDRNDLPPFREGPAAGQAARDRPPATQDSFTSPRVHVVQTGAATTIPSGRQGQHHEPVQQVSGPQGVRCVAWSSDGRWIVVGGISSKLALYDTTLAPRASVKVGGWTASVLSCALSPDGSLVAAAIAAFSPSAALWNLTTRQLVQRMKHSSNVSAVAFSPDGLRLATGCGDGVRMWSVSSGALLLEIAHGRATTCVAFSPDGTALATGGTEGGVTLWDPITGDRLSVIHWQGKRTPVVSLAFSPDGRAIAAADTTTIARVWDARTRELQFEVHHPDAVHAIAYRPDGRRLGSVGSGGLIHLWDVTSGADLLTLHDEFEGTASDLRALAFNPEGDLLATGSNTGLVRIWAVATSQDR
ncbi:MAG TPA: CHAT domain-containing protein [Humibacillus xanthopallidus]|nr:CHAT domain-containing protein [Humibacillus xanthopallidus]